MKICMFRAVPLPIIRSLFAVHSALVYVIQVLRQLSSTKAVLKPVWRVSVLSVQWINSWWWAEELSKTCRFSCWSKFGKLVHPVGFIIKKFVTMHGHMNIYSLGYSLSYNHSLICVKLRIIYLQNTLWKHCSSYFAPRFIAWYIEPNNFPSKYFNINACNIDSSIKIRRN